MQVHLDPAGGAGDVLSVILGSPALQGGRIKCNNTDYDVRLLLKDKDETSMYLLLSA